MTVNLLGHVELSYKYISSDSSKYVTLHVIALATLELCVIQAVADAALTAVSHFGLGPTRCSSVKPIPVSEDTSKSNGCTEALWGFAPPQRDSCP